MLKDDRDSRYLLFLMKDLNFLILLFISSVISYSLNGVINNGEASAFLNKVDVLTIASWKLPVIVICLYISLLFLMNLSNLKNYQVWLRLLIEIFLAFFIVYCIGFSYIGLFLLLIAVTIEFIPKSKLRIPLIIFLCIAYFFFEYIIITWSSKIISFDVYIEYFQSEARIFLKIVLNLLASLNLLLFLIYIISVIRNTSKEKEYILNLNEKLNETNQELQEANIQLENYSREIVTMTETRERNRLAREIHDTLGHTLTGIITGLEACVALIDVAPEATKIQLKSIIEVASQGMTDVRRSVNALRPDRLEKFDLKKAIIDMIDETENATHAQINYTFNVSLDNFSNEEEDTIFRIVQESITNSIRHGRASQISISFSEEDGFLVISIKDNGIGCKNIQKGFGLHHMQERLNLLKGNLEYRGDDGFLVQAKIPIRLIELKI